MKRTPPAAVERQKNGRPVIDGKSYQRVSTLAKAFDDPYALNKWKQRMVALGVAQSPDLIGLACTATADDRAVLDDVAARAMDRAGAGSGRDIGTAVHAVAEKIDYQEPVDNLPRDLVDDAQAFRAECERLGLVPALAETFVVAAQYGAAGSFDRLLTDGKEFYIGDIKTAKVDKDADYAIRYNALKWAIQLAVYSAGRPWNEYWQSWESLGVRPPSTVRGIVFHIPRGSGTCAAIDVDLSIGHRAARLAAEVRDVTTPSLTGTIAQVIA